MTRFIVTCLFLFLATVAAAEDVFEAAERGVWGYAPVGDTCSESHIIRFSADRRQAKFIWNMPITDYEGNSRVSGVYDVIENDANNITMALHGESRTTETGAPVVWVLRILDGDLYCWGRTDWSYFSCTAPRQRCPGETPIG